ncbi:MAG: hypothetical protein QOG83_2128 [Alphaproteobacteria bacterium]|jgi:hypothetical protein|nr:hypothetical protein [Alphaproteobacteria bacterium]MEA2989417.1 hypothetical protein [Alphaproteobacteria bacterium]
MSYVIAFLISMFAGWAVAACDALYKAEDKPGVFQGTPGMLLLLAVTAAGGLVLAGAVVWVLKTIGSASVAVVMIVAALLGGKASDMLNVSASGAANRMLVGLAGLVALYAAAWFYFPAP